ncbi:hypothetical protein [Haliangium sp.]|uniref:hypothetical protein n=1 Tax=Haliangium sp. TaxID=2663208 RepID=UPI003D14FA66
MRIPIDEEFRQIAREILAENKDVDEWADIESDDMFQQGRYAGGGDADEGEFCFSYYGPDGEFWFQMTLAQLEEVAAGATPDIPGHPAV